MPEALANIVVNGVERSWRAPMSLAEVVERYSPFGAEPVLATVGGTTYRSIDDLGGVAVQAGDRIDLFPLIIGG